MACGAINSLMTTIELEFLQPHPRPILQQNEVISPNKELLQSLHEKLGSLIEVFDENMMDGVEAIRHLETRFRDVAFRVEDEIEHHVADLYVQRPQGDTQGCSMLCKIFHPAKGKPTWPSLRLRYILQQAIEDIDAIEEELVKVKEEYEHFNDLQGRKAALDVLPLFDQVITMAHPSQHASLSKEIMVGNNDEFEIVMEMLLGHSSKKREVVSIKGMGGIGKTTEFMKIHQSPPILISEHGLSYQQMLKCLLNSIGNARSGNDEDQSIGSAGSGNNEDLAIRFYQGLKGLRYLIVVD